MHKILVAALAACLVVVVLLSGCGGTTTTAPTDTTTPETSATTAGGTETTAAQGGQPSGDPIVIGAVLSTTGPNAPLGEPERMALELFEKQINAAGGVLGRPLDVIILDDQSSAKEAVTATQRLLQQEKAVALIGSSGSACTLAMKPIAAQGCVPQIATAAGNNITAEAPSEWVWRVAPRDDLAAERAVSYVADTLQVTKVAVLYDENAFGSSGLAQIEKIKGDYGIEVVAKESYKTEETDLTAQLTKLKGANPEALIVWGTNPGPAVAAKNLKQLGWDVPYVGSHGIANAKFIELAADAAEGVVFPSTKILFPESITDPGQKALIDKLIADYTAEFGVAPNHFSSHGWDAIAILVAAIEEAGNTEPAALQTALNSLTNFIGADGIFTYTATDHDGLKVDDLIMVKIEGGTWVLAQ